MPLHQASARVAAIAAGRGAQLLRRDFGIQFNVQFQMARDQILRERTPLGPGPGLSEVKQAIGRAAPVARFWRFNWMLEPEWRSRSSTLLVGLLEIEDRRSELAAPNSIKERCVGGPWGGEAVRRSVGLSVSLSVCRSYRPTEPPPYRFTEFTEFTGKTTHNHGSWNQSTGRRSADWLPERRIPSRAGSRKRLLWSANETFPAPRHLNR